MHHFIFPSQDTWISSGSSTITGDSFKNQNFGRDQILEVKKEFFNNSFNFPTGSRNWRSGFLPIVPVAVHGGSKRIMSNIFFGS